jgi:hypothetical protein
MKKKFVEPELKSYGIMGEVTQAFGANSSTDTIYYGSTTFPGNGGSRDGIVKPL